jgi:hypothetical protein
MHINYYRASFGIELDAIKNKFEEILTHASNDNIKVSELNRNLKAAVWLHNTYANNIEMYETVLDNK